MRSLREDPRQAAIKKCLRPATKRISLQVRMSLVVIAGILVGLLLVAGFLEPDRSGIGTHRQLGLPMCRFIALTGVRCPSCGMTTSWALMANFEIIQALRVNPAGALLFVQAVFSVPVLVGLAATADRRSLWLFSWVSAVFLLVLAVLAVIHWGISLKLL